ncbi:MAG: Ig-like domain-containing protein [Lachnospiraceae bacterium]|nr:Ig-like domain-containing protein [Lachnospiraceae bacterium]
MKKLLFALITVITAVVTISFQSYAYTRNGYNYTLRNSSSSGVTMGGKATETGREISRYGETWYCNGGDFSVNGLWYTVDALDASTSYGDCCDYLFATGKTITDIIGFHSSGVKYVTVGHDNTITRGSTKIHANAFKGCSKIATLNIEKSISSIGSGAFSDMKGAKIVCKNPSAPSAYNNTFSQEAYETATLWVPDGSKANYQNSTGWKNFKKILAESDAYIIFCFDYDTPKIIMENQSVTLAMMEYIGNRNFRPISNQFFSFESSDTSVATVDENGCLKGIKKGTVVISATHWNGDIDKFELTVVKPASDIEIFEAETNAPLSTISIIAGDSLKLLTKLYPEDSNDTIKWRNENIEIAIIDSVRIVHAFAPGETKITAKTLSGLEKSLIVSVAPQKVESVTFTNKFVYMEKGESKLLNVSILPHNATYKDIEWSTKDNDGIIEISQDGCISALKVGEATVIAYSPSSNLSDSCKIIVKPTDIQRLYFNWDIVTLTLGETELICPFVLPSNATVSNIEWSNDNPEVVEVNAGADGDKTWAYITALSEGEAHLRVSGQTGLPALCEVRVKKPKLQQIAIEENNLKLKITEPYQLNWHALPIEADVSNIQWHSSDETVAKVTDTGLVYPISPGNAIIEASCGHIIAKCNIRVMQPVEEILISENNTKLCIGDYFSLNATILPDNADNKSVLWESNNRDVVTVDEKGCIYAKKEGAADIHAYSVDNPKVSNSCKVTVVQLATRVSLNVESLELEENKSFQLEATVIPDNTSDKTVNWESSDTSVAVVSPDGIVSAIKKGSALIIVSTTDGSNLSAICEILVNDNFVPINQISINPSSVRLAVDETFNLDAQITPVDATNKNINWSSTNPSVVIVDSNGQLSAKGIGTATIVASSQDGSNLSGTCNVEVFEPTVLISSITIDPSTVTGNIGETYQLTATITPKNASDTTLAWSSDNPKVASVDSEGLISLHTKGNAIIKVSATDGSGISGICAVVVDEGAGINDIEIDDNQYVRIYNLHGVLVYEGVYSESNLVLGTYIIISQGGRIKRIIK